MTPLSVLLDRARVSAGRLTVEVPDDWMQGRSVYGGLQLALAVRAMRTLVADVPLRTVQATLVAPVAGQVEIRSRILRTGKNTTHVEERIGDDDGTSAIFIAVFGQARDSKLALAPRQPPFSRESAPSLPFLPGLTPSFLQHFDARVLEGSLPFSGQGMAHSVFEAGIRDDGPTSESHVLAIADFTPPLALAYLKTPAAGSTLTWMLELLTSDFDSQPLSGWRIDAELVAAHQGYTHQSMILWAPDGAPVALGRQCMLVFG